MAKLESILSELTATKETANDILEFIEELADISDYEVDVRQCDAKNDWYCDIIRKEGDITILHLSSESVSDLRQSMNAFLVGMQFANMNKPHDTDLELPDASERVDELRPNASDDDIHLYNQAVADVINALRKAKVLK